MLSSLDLGSFLVGFSRGFGKPLMRIRPGSVAAGRGGFGGYLARLRSSSSSGPGREVRERGPISSQAQNNTFFYRCLVYNKLKPCRHCSRVAGRRRRPLGADS